MGLLYGSNALKSLQDYKTQQDFNNSVIVSLQNVANAVDVVTKTAGDNGASLIEKQNAIDGLKNSLSALQSNFSTLSSSFANLNTDNGQFKSDVDSTISTFNATVASFSGSLTSLTAANQQNTNDINTLKQTTNNDLLQKVMTGLTTIKDTIDNYIQDNYQGKFDAAIAKVENDLKTSIATNQTDISSQQQWIAGQLASATQEAASQVMSLTSTLQNLQNSIQQSNSSFQASINTNATNISNEVERAQNAEGDLNAHINTVDSGLATEVKRAKQAESDLTNSISQTAQTASNEVQQAVNTAENYSDNNLTKAKAYTDQTTNSLNSSVTAAFQAGDQKTLTASNDYADKLHAELLQTANAALDNSTTAENIAQEAQANATDAEGKVNALTPQVTAASTKAAQALTVAQGAPQVGFNTIQGRTYSDGLVSITSSGSSITITPANGAFMLGNYNGSTTQVGTYTLSSGYVYTCQIMGPAGIGFYMVDNRNSGTIYATILSPPSK